MVRSGRHANDINVLFEWPLVHRRIGRLKHALGPFKSYALCINIPCDANSVTVSVPRMVSIYPENR